MSAESVCASTWCVIREGSRSFPGGRSFPASYFAIVTKIILVATAAAAVATLTPDDKFLTASRQQLLPAASRTTTSRAATSSLSSSSSIVLDRDHSGRALPPAAPKRHAMTIFHGNVTGAAHGADPSASRRAPSVSSASPSINIVVRPFADTDSARAPAVLTPALPQQYAWTTLSCDNVGSAAFGTVVPFVCQHASSTSSPSASHVDTAGPRPFLTIGRASEHNASALHMITTIRHNLRPWAARHSPRAISADASYRLETATAFVLAPGQTVSTSPSLWLTVASRLSTNYVTAPSLLAALMASRSSDYLSVLSNATISSSPPLLTGIHLQSADPSIALPLGEQRTLPFCSPCLSYLIDWTYDPAQHDCRTRECDCRSVVRSVVAEYRVEMNTNLCWVPVHFTVQRSSSRRAAVGGGLAIDREGESFPSAVDASLRMVNRYECSALPASKLSGPKLPLRDSIVFSYSGTVATHSSPSVPDCSPATLHAQRVCTSWLDYRPSCDCASETMVASMPTCTRSDRLALPATQAWSRVFPMISAATSAAVTAESTAARVGCPLASVSDCCPASAGHSSCTTHLIVRSAPQTIFHLSRAEHAAMRSGYARQHALRAGRCRHAWSDAADRLAPPATVPAVPSVRTYSIVPGTVFGCDRTVAVLPPMLKSAAVAACVCLVDSADSVLLVVPPSDAAAVASGNASSAAPAISFDGLHALLTPMHSCASSPYIPDVRSCVYRSSEACHSCFARNPFVWTAGSCGHHTDGYALRALWGHATSGDSSPCCVQYSMPDRPFCTMPDASVSMTASAGIELSARPPPLPSSGPQPAATVVACACPDWRIQRLTDAGSSFCDRAPPRALPTVLPAILFGYSSTVAHAVIRCRCVVELATSSIRHAAWQPATDRPLLEPCSPSLEYPSLDLVPQPALRLVASARFAIAAWSAATADFASCAWADDASTICVAAAHLIAGAYITPPPCALEQVPATTTSAIGRYLSRRAVHVLLCLASLPSQSNHSVFVWNLAIVARACPPIAVCYSARRPFRVLRHRVSAWEGEISYCACPVRHAISISPPAVNSRASVRSSAHAFVATAAIARFVAPGLCSSTRCRSNLQEDFTVRRHAPPRTTELCVLAALLSAVVYAYGTSGKRRARPSITVGSASSHWLLRASTFVWLLPSALAMERPLDETLQAALRPLLSSFGIAAIASALAAVECMSGMYTSLNSATRETTVSDSAPASPLSQSNQEGEQHCAAGSTGDNHSPPPFERDCPGSSSGVYLSPPQTKAATRRIPRPPGLSPPATVRHTAIRSLISLTPSSSTVTQPSAADRRELCAQQAEARRRVSVSDTQPDHTAPPSSPVHPGSHRVGISRQTQRSRAFAEQRDRRLRAVSLAAPRTWMALLRAAHVCYVLRRRALHRRAVLTRCTLLLHPPCSRFIAALRAGRRLRALELISRRPRPILRDVGYDSVTGRFSFRDVHGRVTSSHPAAPADACLAMLAYAPDGTFTLPLSPPHDSTVVLSPESSGCWCYYDTALGDASWFPPVGSTPLRHQLLTSVQLPPEPPPDLPATIRLNSLRFTGWTPFFRDATNEVFLMNLSTGAVREGPWISLRTAGGLIYFANLVSRETRYLPPHCWMNGWISRMSHNDATYAADCHPCASLPEGRAYDTRMPQIGVYGRQCVEGGAPYLCDSGRPQYPPDEFDTPETYPLDGFVRLPETQTYSDRHRHHVRVGPRWVPAAISPAESAAAPQAAPQPDSRLHDSNDVLRAAALSSPPPPPSSGNHSDTGSDRHSDTSDDILSEVYFGATGGDAVENNVVGTGEDAIESDRLGSPSSDTISGEHSASGSTASGSLRPTPSGSAMPLTTEPDFRSFAQQASLIGAISASDARAISLQLMRGTVTALEAVAELVLRISPYERAGGIIARAWRRYAFYSLENAGYTHDDAGRSGLILLDPPFRFLTRHTDGVTHLLTALSVGGL